MAAATLRSAGYRSWLVRSCAVSQLPYALLCGHTSAPAVCTTRRWVTHSRPRTHAQLLTTETSSSLRTLGYLDPVPPPPPILAALFRWTIASAILAFGTCIELPLLVVWRVLHTLSPRRDDLTPAMLQRVRHSLLSLSYHCRIRYCYHVLRALHVTVRVVNHNRQPFALDIRPHLFVQCNQCSLLEPLCFHAASYIEYRARKARRLPCEVLGLLSTPHFFINVEYGLWPLLGWVQGLTAVWVVRQHKQQARRALDRMIHRMSSRANIVSANHSSADLPAPSLPSAALWPDSFYISPEGGRSSSPSPQPYRTGAAIAAISACAVVVPVIMRGVRQCMPKGEWRVRGGECEVLYDEVINSTGLRYEDRQQLTAHIQARYERRLASDIAKTKQRGEHR